MVVGGIIGALLGAGIFALLQRLGQIDTVIAILYVVMLGSIGLMMANESIQALLARPQARPHPPASAATTRSSRRCRCAALLSLGALHLTVGAAAARHRLGDRHDADGHRRRLHPRAGDDLRARHDDAGGHRHLALPDSFVTMATTLVHSITTCAVDLVLAFLPLIGSVAGAQIGGRLSMKLRSENLRIILALIVLVVAVRMALGPGWRPDEIMYGDGAVTVRPSLATALLAPVLIGAATPQPVLVPDVSQREIEIRYSFTGAELLLSGAILYPQGRLPDKPADIIVVLKGPPQSIVMREKRKIAGIWVNADSAAFRSAPSFYAYASSKPLDKLVDARTAAIYELGLGNLQLLSPASLNDSAEIARFSAGLNDLRGRADLFVEKPGTVEISDGVLYRARVSRSPRGPWWGTIPPRPSSSRTAGWSQRQSATSPCARAASSGWSGVRGDLRPCLRPRRDHPRPRHGLDRGTGRQAVLRNASEGCPRRAAPGSAGPPLIGAVACSSTVPSRHLRASASPIKDHAMIRASAQFCASPLAIAAEIAAVTCGIAAKFPERSTCSPGIALSAIGAASVTAGAAAGPGRACSMTARRAGASRAGLRAAMTKGAFPPPAATAAGSSGVTSRIAVETSPRPIAAPERIPQNRPVAPVMRMSTVAMSRAAS